MYHKDNLQSKVHDSKTLFNGRVTPKYNVFLAIAFVHCALKGVMFKTIFGFTINVPLS